MSYALTDDNCPECGTLLEADGYCNTCNKITGPPLEDEDDYANE